MGTLLLIKLQFCYHVEMKQYKKIFDIWASSQENVFSGVLTR